MGIIEILLIAVSLSMDAFAVSVCKGLSSGKRNIKNALTCGLWFGVFQGLMPLIGYFLGSALENYIKAVDHWIAFILLALIGGNMIRESFSKDEEESCDSFSPKAMFPLAIATSIDALAVGVTFALTGAPVVLSVSLIAVITFALSTLGCILGVTVGAKFKSIAERIGGAVLVLMGLKILLEHLGVI